MHHAQAIDEEGLGVSSDCWERLDEAHDLAVVRQLLPVSCGPACGAMCLRHHHIMVTQSAVALAQGSVLTHDAVRLAEAMNRLAGYQGWLGAFVDVFTNPRQTFTALIAHGPFATTLHAFGMRMSHMVVVDGFDSMERVIIRDPGRGTRYLMLWDEFTRVWEGQTVWRVMP
jgi:ABC-type bacteriocin/lantibiotic exporter with double-glycine peptidase domain